MLADLTLPCEIVAIYPGDLSMRVPSHPTHENAMQYFGYFMRRLAHDSELSKPENLYTGGLALQHPIQQARHSNHNNNETINLRGS